jgi:MFS family permease
MASHAASVFRSRTFRLFYIGQALSYIGDGLRTIAIPLLVYHLTGSALSVSVTYALEFFPFAIFGLLGGSFADRVDRRKLMIACDAIRFLIITAFALAYAHGALSLPVLYAGITAIAVAAAFFGGSQASSIPYVVGKDRATQALSALHATEQASQLVTPPIGGALFALTGPLPALAINAVTYFCSQLSLAAAGNLGPETARGIPRPSHVLADIRDGFRFLFADAAMRAFTIVHGFLNFFAMMTVAVFIPYFKRDFGASDAQVGLALGAIAVGAIAGSLAAGATVHRWPFGRMLVASYAIDGLLFIPLTITHRFGLAVAFLALGHAFGTFEITHILGWRMRIIPEELVGRVFGAVRLVVMSGIVPGLILGGYLTDHYDARLAIEITTAGYLLMAPIAWMIPAMRHEAR